MPDVAAATLGPVPSDPSRRTRPKLESAKVAVQVLHGSTPLGWDENPGITFWGTTVGISYLSGSDWSPEVVIARAALCRVDCRLCLEIGYELDNISADLGSIGGVIDDSKRLYDHGFYGGANTVFLIAEDVVVDRFWRGRRLGPATVLYGSGMLQTEATFLVPAALGTRVDVDGECISDYGLPRRGPEALAKVKASWHRAGFRKIGDHVLWRPALDRPEQHHGDDESARSTIAGLQSFADSAPAKAWYRRRLARCERSAE